MTPMRTSEMLPRNGMTCDAEQACVLTLELAKRPTWVSSSNTGLDPHSKHLSTSVILLVDLPLGLSALPVSMQHVRCEELGTVRE